MQPSERGSFASKPSQYLQFRYLPLISLESGQVTSLWYGRVHGPDTNPDGSTPNTHRLVVGTSDTKFLCYEFSVARGIPTPPRVIAPLLELKRQTRTESEGVLSKDVLRSVQREAGQGLCDEASLGPASFRFVSKMDHVTTVPVQYSDDDADPAVIDVIGCPPLDLLFGLLSNGHCIVFTLSTMRFMYILHLHDVIKSPMELDSTDSNDRSEGKTGKKAGHSGRLLDRMPSLRLSHYFGLGGLFTKKARGSSASVMGEETDAPLPLVCAHKYGALHATAHRVFGASQQDGLFLKMFGKNLAKHHPTFQTMAVHVPKYACPHGTLNTYGSVLNNGADHPKMVRIRRVLDEAGKRLSAGSAYASASGDAGVGASRGAGTSSEPCGRSCRAHHGAHSSSAYLAERLHKYRDAYMSSHRRWRCCLRCCCVPVCLVALAGPKYVYVLAVSRKRAEAPTRTRRPSTTAGQEAADCHTRTDNGFNFSDSRCLFKDGTGELQVGQLLSTGAPRDASPSQSQLPFRPGCGCLNCAPVPPHPVMNPIRGLSMDGEPSVGSAMSQSADTSNGGSHISHHTGAPAERKAALSKEGTSTDGTAAVSGEKPEASLRSRGEHTSDAVSGKAEPSSSRGVDTELPVTNTAAPASKCSRLNKMLHSALPIPPPRLPAMPLPDGDCHYSLVCKPIRTADPVVRLEFVPAATLPHLRHQSPQWPSDTVSAKAAAVYKARTAALAKTCSACRMSNCPAIRSHAAVRDGASAHTDSSEGGGDNGGVRSDGSSGAGGGGDSARGDMGDCASCQVTSRFLGSQIPVPGSFHQPAEPSVGTGDTAYAEPVEEEPVELEHPSCCAAFMLPPALLLTYADRYTVYPLPGGGSKYVSGITPLAEQPPSPAVPEYWVAPAATEPSKGSCSCKCHGGQKVASKVSAKDLWPSAAGVNPPPVHKHTSPLLASANQSTMPDGGWMSELAGLMGSDGTDTSNKSKSRAQTQNRKAERSTKLARRKSTLQAGTKSSFSNALWLMEKLPWIGSKLGRALRKTEFELSRFLSVTDQQWDRMVASEVSLCKEIHGCLWTHLLRTLHRQASRQKSIEDRRNTRAADGTPSPDPSVKKPGLFGKMRSKLSGLFKKDKKPAAGSGQKTGPHPPSTAPPAGSTWRIPAPAFAPTVSYPLVMFPPDLLRLLSERKSRVSCTFGADVVGGSSDAREMKQESASIVGQGPGPLCRVLSPRLFAVCMKDCAVVYDLMTSRRFRLDPPGDQLKVSDKKKKKKKKKTQESPKSPRKALMGPADSLGLCRPLVRFPIVPVSMEVQQLLLMMNVPPSLDDSEPQTPHSSGASTTTGTWNGAEAASSVHSPRAFASPSPTHSVARSDAAIGSVNDGFEAWVDREDVEDEAEFRRGLAASSLTEGRSELHVRSRAATVASVDTARTPVHSAFSLASPGRSPTLDGSKIPAHPQKEERKHAIPLPEAKTVRVPVRAVCMLFPTHMQIFTTRHPSLLMWHSGSSERSLRCSLHELEPSSSLVPMAPLALPPLHFAGPALCLPSKLAEQRNARQQLSDFSLQGAVGQSGVAGGLGAFNGAHWKWDVLKALRLQVVPRLTQLTRESGQVVSKWTSRTAGCLSESPVTSHPSDDGEAGTATSSAVFKVSDTSLEDSLRRTQVLYAWWFANGHQFVSSEFVTFYRRFLRHLLQRQSAGAKFDETVWTSWLLERTLHERALQQPSIESPSRVQNRMMHAYWRQVMRGSQASYAGSARTRHETTSAPAVLGIGAVQDSEWLPSFISLTPMIVTEQDLNAVFAAPIIQSESGSARSPQSSSGPSASRERTVRNLFGLIGGGDEPGEDHTTGSSPAADAPAAVGTGGGAGANLFLTQCANAEGRLVRTGPKGFAAHQHAHPQGTHAGAEGKQRGRRRRKAAVEYSGGAEWFYALPGSGEGPMARLRALTTGEQTDVGAGAASHGLPAAVENAGSQASVAEITTVSGIAEITTVSEIEDGGGDVTSKNTAVQSPSPDQTADDDVPRTPQPTPVVGNLQLLMRGSASPQSPPPPTPAVRREGGQIVLTSGLVQEFFVSFIPPPPPRVSTVSFLMPPPPCADVPLRLLQASGRSGRDGVSAGGTEGSKSSHRSPEGRLGGARYRSPSRRSPRAPLRRSISQGAAGGPLLRKALSPAAADSGSSPVAILGPPGASTHSKCSTLSSSLSPLGSLGSGGLARSPYTAGMLGMHSPSPAASSLVPRAGLSVTPPPSSNNSGTVVAPQRPLRPPLPFPPLPRSLAVGGVSLKQNHDAVIGSLGCLAGPAPLFFGWRGAHIWSVQPLHAQVVSLDTRFMQHILNFVRLHKIRQAYVAQNLLTTRFQTITGPIHRAYPELSAVPPVPSLSRIALPLCQELQIALSPAKGAPGCPYEQISRLLKAYFDRVLIGNVGDRPGYLGSHPLHVLYRDFLVQAVTRFHAAWHVVAYPLLASMKRCCAQCRNSDARKTDSNTKTANSVKPSEPLSSGEQQPSVWARKFHSLGLCCRRAVFVRARMSKPLMGCERAAPCPCLKLLGPLTAVQLPLVDTESFLNHEQQHTTSSATYTDDPSLHPLLRVVRRDNCRVVLRQLHQTLAPRTLSGLSAVSAGILSSTVRFMYDIGRHMGAYYYPLRTILPLMCAEEGFKEASKASECGDVLCGVNQWDHSTSQPQSSHAHQTAPSPMVSDGPVTDLRSSSPGSRPTSGARSSESHVRQDTCPLYYPDPGFYNSEFCDPSHGDCGGPHACRRVVISYYAQNVELRELVDTSLRQDPWLRQRIRCSVRCQCPLSGRPHIGNHGSDTGASWSDLCRLLVGSFGRMSLPSVLWMSQAEVMKRVYRSVFPLRVSLTRISCAYMSVLARLGGLALVHRPAHTLQPPKSWEFMWEAARFPVRTHSSTDQSESSVADAKNEDNTASNRDSSDRTSGDTRGESKEESHSRSVGGSHNQSGGRSKQPPESWNPAWIMRVIDDLRADSSPDGQSVRSSESDMQQADDSEWKSKLVSLLECARMLQSGLLSLDSVSGRLQHCVYVYDCLVKSAGAVFRAYRKWKAERAYQRELAEHQQRQRHVLRRTASGSFSKTDGTSDTNKSTVTVSGGANVSGSLVPESARSVEKPPVKRVKISVTLSAEELQPFWVWVLGYAGQSFGAPRHTRADSNGGDASSDCKHPSHGASEGTAKSTEGSSDCTGGDQLVGWSAGFVEQALAEEEYQAGVAWGPNMSSLQYLSAMMSTGAYALAAAAYESLIGVRISAALGTTRRRGRSVTARDPASATTQHSGSGAAGGDNGAGLPLPAELRPYVNATSRGSTVPIPDILQQDDDLFD